MPAEYGFWRAISGYFGQNWDVRKGMSHATTSCRDSRPRLSLHKSLLLPSSPHMRAAAILGLGCSPKHLKPFQADVHSLEKLEWRIGMPSSPDPADVILLFGGDGTIHRHLAQLVRLGLPVLIVPAGSGNDFARALGIRSVRDALSAWRKFCSGERNVRAIDLGTIIPLNANGNAESRELKSSDAIRNPVPDTRYFSCIAGVGLDGEVSRRANRLPRWLRGHGGYALSLAPAIFSFAPLPVKILAPPAHAQKEASPPTHESWTIRSDQPTILAAFANAPVYGGGMRIAPQAKMDDGLLDVCVVAGVDPFKLFCMFPTVYYGKHLKIREVNYFCSQRVRVETEHPLDVYADGEFVCRTPVEIGIKQAALNVIVPTSAIP
jgi:diacylglycerol kinase (ATP)